MAEGVSGETHGAPLCGAALSPQSDSNEGSPPAPRRTLRKSCDACKDAKVRCEGHGKPCPRCLARGIHCHYGWSNRGYGARHSRYAGSVSELPTIPLAALDTAWGQAFPDFNQPWRSPTPGSGAESSNGTASADPFAPFGAFAAPSSFDLSSLALSNPTPTLCDCFVSLLSTLQTLETSTAPTGRPGQIYTSILALNQPAAETCARTLSCVQCTHEATPTTLMLLATVLGKLGTLYTTAALDCYSALPSPILAAPAECEAFRRARQAVLAPHLARFEEICDVYDDLFSGPVYEGGIAGSLVIYLRGHLLTLAGLCDWTTVDR